MPAAGILNGAGRGDSQRSRPRGETLSAGTRIFADKLSQIDFYFAIVIAVTSYIQVGTNTAKKFPTWRGHHLCKGLCGLQPFHVGT